MEKSGQPGGARNIIGKHIRAARLVQNPPVSQEDLTARLAKRGIYIDRSALSRIENEERFVRDYEILGIAESLKVSIESLFTGRTDEKQQRHKGKA